MEFIETLLLELKEKGVILKIKDNELKISAPKGILTPELTSDIKVNKEKILGLLKNLNKSSLDKNIPKAKRDSNLPLSFSQQRMWFLNQLEGEKGTYHIPFPIKIEGQLNLEKLYYVVDKIVKRHETLRTIFPSVDGMPIQKILDDYKIDIDFADLSLQPKYRDENNIKQLIKEKIVIPFNLAEGPVFRTNVFKIDEDVHILLFVFHGIAADGWSAGVLFNELTTLYENDKSDFHLLDNIEIQFADFAVWQRQLYDSKVFEPQLEYWKKQLEDLPAILDFPFDYPRKAIHHFIGKRNYFKIDNEVTLRLNELIKLNGTSPFMLLWGVYAYLLYRYSGQHDIVIGTPIANRSKKDLEKLIGFFANTLIMRIKINPELTVREYLSQIKQISLDAFSNQDYPFDQLIEEIDPQRTLAHSPLFQTMFVLQNTPMNISERTKLKISTLEVEIDVAHFDLTLVVNNFDDEIDGFLEFNNALIKPESAERLIKHYISILNEFANKPNAKLSEVELILKEEKEEILEKCKEVLSIPAKNKGLYELYEEAIKVFSNKDAILFEGKTLTYAEFDKEVHKITDYLVEQGVKPGDVVAVLLNRSFNLIETIVAIIKCGAAYLPINHEFPQKRIETILQESQTNFLVCDNKAINKLSFISAKNLRVLDKTEFILTNLRSVITDLDSLPLPDRGSVDYSKYSKYIGTGPVTSDISILASRGCPYNCIYCHKIWPKRQMIRSSENVFDEVKKYYDCGIRRFTFLDDIFNLNKEVSSRFFEMVIAKLPGTQLFFPNGLRADILTEEYIDLMVEAGLVDVALALESGSPRIQKMIRKNLNLDKFLNNIKYLAEKHPHVLLELQTMFGFPTETEEEALMTLETIKKVKWIDFPNLHVLKVFPNSEIYKLAIENGVSEKSIRISSNLPYHALPETLPYSKEFARHFQASYMNEYFLNKERLLSVLPTQFSIFTISEMVQKYDSFLPYHIESFDDILKYTGVKREELGEINFVPDNKYEVPDINEKLKKYFPIHKPAEDSLRILLLDVSNLFTSMNETMLHHQIEEPIGLMYLLANLKKSFGDKINGKIAKALVDFDSFEELRKMITEFKPHIIGFRTLSIYKEFFHLCITVAKQIYSEASIIVGGPYVTSEYDTILSDSNIDIAVISEGEITLNEFIDRYIESGMKIPEDKVLEKINGIAFVPHTKRKELRRDGFNRNVILLDYLSERNSVDSQNILGQPGKGNGNLAYVLYTSGSTGIPKGVAMGHRGAANLINWHFNDPLLSIPMKTLQFASISFDVSFQEIFSTLASGGTLYLIDDELRRDPYELLLFIDKNKIGRLFLPVVALQQLAVAAKDRNLYPLSIKQIIAAGEQLKITEQIRLLFSKLDNAVLINHYGPTESHVVTTYQLDGKPEEWTDLPPIGKPVENTSIFLLDENDKLVPQGLRGEIYIAGESLAEGYYRNPEMTEERFVEKKFNGFRLYKTGDLGRLSQDGNIEYLGRVDDQVKIRGFRVEPGEIETVINKIPGVENSAVIVSDINTFGNSLIAFVKYSADEKYDSDFLKRVIEKELPDYMMPSKIIIVDNMPTNSSGKIDKKNLSEKIVLSKRNENIEIINEQEELLLNIWKDILNVGHLGIEDNFFRAGGHSLLATQVVSRVRNLFNIDIQLRSIFEYPTVKKLSEFLSNELSKNNTLSKPVFIKLKADDLRPVSFNQKYYWELDKKYPGKNINNIAGAYKIEEELDIERFLNAINKIIERHEILRTTFFETGDELFQKINSSDDHKACYKDFSDLSKDEIDKLINIEKEQICLKPFNLIEEAASRFLLIKTTDKEFVFLYAIHHIGLDGWSFGIIMKELNTYYNSAQLNAEGMLQPGITYSDYSSVQRKWIENGNLESQRSYWRQTLEGYNFKSENTQVERLDIETETIKISINSQVIEKLLNVCRKKDISLFMLLLTAFAEMFGEKKNKSDFVVGTYIAGREYTELENMIGCFVNILLLRIRQLDSLKPDEKFSEIRNVCLEAYRNQSFPINLVLKSLPDINDNTLHNMPDTMFVLQNNVMNELKIGRANLKAIDLKHIDSPVALQCSVFNNNECLDVAFTFQKSRYNAKIIEEMLQNYKEKLLSYAKNFN